MKLYLCGPMTGMPLWNFPAFRLAEKILRDAGFEVINPATIHGDLSALSDDELTANRHQYLKTDIAAMLTADGVCMLPGWGNSKGATLEVGVAEAVGIPCDYQHGWITHHGQKKTNDATETPAKSTSTVLGS